MMPILYLELSDHFPDNKNGKYITLLKDKIFPGYYRFLQCADRIWKEETGNVIFLKNRYKVSQNLTDEELEEFVWVKLRSKHM